MDILIAIGHIAGSALAWMIFIFATMFVTAWGMKRKEEQLRAEAATSLGISPEKLSDESHEKELAKYISEKYSEEHFKNRFSDLCYGVITVWAFIGLLLMLMTIGVTIWFMISEGLDNAVFAWGLVVIQIVFSTVYGLFAVLCRLLTGRYPGQAREGRKAIEDWLMDREPRKQIHLC